MLTLIFGSAAHAMDAFEYQVYDNEINKPASYSLETHVNTNIKGTAEPDYLGKLDEDHLTHLTLEFARGMTANWEMGAYLQTAMGKDGIYRYAGAKLRSKFVRPRTEGNPFQYGVNFEISNVPSEFELDRWGGEIRPIFGYTIDRFTFLINPIIGLNLTPLKSLTPAFSPAVKGLFDTKEGYGIGLEYYGDFGEIDRVPVLRNGPHYIFVVLDLLNGPIELDLGLGAGLVSSANPCVAKAIFGFGF